MADRKLLTLFPDASRPLSLEEAESFLCAARDKHGDIHTFFGLPVYQNPIGLELEVEHHVAIPLDSFYWRTDDDASLKKAGCEFISVPLRGRNIDYALLELEKFYNDTGKAWEFSHRTSMHVHCNVSTYTKNQLRALMGVYALVEELLFQFCEARRRASGFAYRLVGTPADIIVYSHDKEGDECTKYCALNIQPIRRQLTVEFRHLEGTMDMKKIRRWIQLVAKLVGYVEKLNPKTCIQLVSDSIVNQQVPALIADIWGETGSLFERDQIEQSVNNGQLWALALLTKE